MIKKFVGMGQDIFENYKIARETFEECDEALGFKLTDIMFKGPQSTLTLTENAQPAILCHSIALLRVLQTDFGFNTKNCKYIIGHSLGEYSALVASESIKLTDAVKLVVFYELNQASQRPSHAELCDQQKNVFKCFASVGRSLE